MDLGLGSTSTAAPQRALLPGREVLQRLPLALVLLDAQNRAVWTNDKFDELLDLAAVGPLVFVDADSQVGDFQFERQLPGRQGPDRSFCLNSVAMDGGRLLALEDAAGVGKAETLRELRQRIVELERDSLTDRLTGAWNRRYLDQVIGAELARSRRHRQPLAAAMLDIDHFKAVNDRFGHTVGDSVLCEFAALVRRNIRDGDVLVRWGGEEFLVLMPFTTHAAALVAANRIRAAVAAHAFAGAGAVTVSAGVAEAIPVEDPIALFERADSALYRAKEGGRNRVAADARGASDLWDNEEEGHLVSLVWRPRYACGNPTIDSQHKELFRRANVLIAAGLRVPPERGALLAAVEALVAHLSLHFAAEEEILAAHGYTKLTYHAHAHRVLLQHAVALRESAARGEARIGAIVEFLAYEVVAHHLLSDDKDFFPLFAVDGLGAPRHAQAKRPKAVE